MRWWGQWKFHLCIIDWHHVFWPWLTLNSPRSRSLTSRFKCLECGELAHKIRHIYRQYAICLDTLTDSIGHHIHVAQKESICCYVNDQVITAITYLRAIVSNPPSAHKNKQNSRQAPGKHCTRAAHLPSDQQLRPRIGRVALITSSSDFIIPRDVITTTWSSAHLYWF